MSEYDIVELTGNFPWFLQSRKEEPVTEVQGITVDLGFYGSGNDPQVALYQKVCSLAERLVCQGERKRFEVSHRPLDLGDDVFDSVLRARRARDFFTQKGYTVGNVLNLPGYLGIELGK